MSVTLACIPLAFVLVYAPKIAVSIAMARQPEGYDNENPRDQQAKLTGWGKRAAAAHANGFEAFAPFAAGALIAHVMNAHPQAAAALAITHVAARTLYPVLYIANVDKVRSLVWGIGALASAGLMILPLV